MPNARIAIGDDNVEIALELAGEGATGRLTLRSDDVQVVADDDFFPHDLIAFERALVRLAGMEARGEDALAPVPDARGISVVVIGSDRELRPMVDFSSEADATGIEVKRIDGDLLIRGYAWTPALHVIALLPATPERLADLIEQARAAVAALGLDAV